MKWSECRPELKRRIQEQLNEQATRPESGLRPTEPEHASEKTLERRNSKSKQGKVGVELRVTIIALRGKELDSHDNAKSACKALIDIISEYLGIKDNDPRIEWNIEQLKSKTRRTLVVMERI